MAKVIELEQPQPQQSILSEEQIKEVQPKYCKIGLVGKYLNVSRSTGLRIIDAAIESGFDNIKISLSPTLALIRLDVLDEYLDHANGKWM